MDIKRIYIFRGMDAEKVFLMIEFTNGKAIHIQLTAAELFSLFSHGVKIEDA